MQFDDISDSMWNLVEHLSLVRDHIFVHDCFEHDMMDDNYNFINECEK